MNYLQQALAALATLVILTTPALAHDYQLGDLRIDHPWSRATPPGAPVGGGFMTVHNDGATGDRLLGGEADFARRVEVHESRMEGDTATMRPVEGGLPIPAGGSVALEPGSYHLMIMGLSERLVEGERRSVTLHFEQAGEVTVEFQVDAMGARPEHEGH